MFSGELDRKVLQPMNCLPSNSPQYRYVSPNSASRHLRNLTERAFQLLNGRSAVAKHSTGFVRSAERLSKERYAIIQ